MLRLPDLCRKVSDAAPAMRSCSESLRDFAQGEGGASPEKYPFAEREKAFVRGPGEIPDFSP